MFLIFDTETTGLALNFNAPVTDTESWPRMVQLAWQLQDVEGKLLSQKSYIVKPDGFNIPYNAASIHGITTERAEAEGHDLNFVLEEFSKDVGRSFYLVGHNVQFDINVVGCEYFRQEIESNLIDIPSLDTQRLSTNYCALPGGRRGQYKYPKLEELHQKLFGHKFEAAHDAAYDVDATTHCFFELLKRKVIQVDEVKDVALITYEAPDLDTDNFKKAVEFEKETQKTPSKSDKFEAQAKLEDVPFVHLHCHSQFSVLQATTDVKSLIARAKELEMPSITMCDHGNMMGAFQFVSEAGRNDIKAIIGCELNLCKDRNDKSNKDDGYQTVLIAKNKKGYQNLSKLSSYAYTEGFYYLPRIDRGLLLEYKEDLIVTTGGLWGEVPYLILNVGEPQAEEAFLWWKENFGEDFYAELNRHDLEEEEVVNQTLLKFCEKHNVKYFAANNTYYTNREDASAHDILLCVKDAENVSTPKKYIGKRGREFRFGFPNDEFYIKSKAEMVERFADLPEAINTTAEIDDKIEAYELKRDVLLPKFEIPEQFIVENDEDGKAGENKYLSHLTYEGAAKRYSEISDDIRERLDFELETIKNTGYPGYFLIVADFINKARELGVSVGPGRGSAAGSAVAYCIGITNIDPIKYDLLFERFLNPDRVSLPDIDIDFDDEGRQSVIDYVIDKYGENQVAQIMTYGTMAAKSAIRDTARVLSVPLSDADRLAKLIPDMSKLSKIFSWTPKEMSGKLKSPEDIENAKQLISISEGNDELSKTINQARVIEGSVRNTGIHACGVIITPDDITNYVPIARAKDTGMYCTQFDNAVVESAGMLKMDFLGLKTLTLIKHTVQLVKEQHGIELDMDNISLEDEKTYQLFQRGDTVGIFQYESPGMRKHLKDLKPTAFADLIAMNALYRPGPMEYIPSFIKRKHGEEEITYDLADMEEYLKETYGITVYQEQVMLLSQKLAGFTKGEADVLRKAMGKKIFSLLEELKPKFLDQGEERGHPRKVLEKIWKDWEAFASYAFNKSHSTCYAWVAYQTAYLKAHYPAEYMSSVLTNNMNDIKKVTFFMEECKRMQLPVLGPDVNESAEKFAPNTEGQIRFALSGIKGVGSGPVAAIVDERKENGPFKSVFDLTTRVDLRQVNKRCIESLAYAGAFDSFEGFHRSKFFSQMIDEPVTVIEKAVKYGQMFKNNKATMQNSLFGDTIMEEIQEPKVPESEPWDLMQKLRFEQEYIGIYLSGHPLDNFKTEMRYLVNTQISDLKDGDLKSFQKKTIKMGGIITSAAHLVSKKGKPYGTFTLEDYSGTMDFRLFSKDYMKFKDYISKDWYLFIEGTVDERGWGDNEHELVFKIREIDLLSSVREKKSLNLTLSIPYQKIKPVLVQELESLVKEYEGKDELTLQLFDADEQIGVNMGSKLFRVNVCDELIETINEKDFLSVKVI